MHKYLSSIMDTSNIIVFHLGLLIANSMPTFELCLLIFGAIAIMFDVAAFVAQRQHSSQHYLSSVMAITFQNDLMQELILDYLSVKDLIVYSAVNRSTKANVDLKIGHRTPHVFRDIWTREMGQLQEHFNAQVGCGPLDCAELYHKMIKVGLFLDRRITKPRYLMYGLLSVTMSASHRPEMLVCIAREIRPSRFRLWSCLMALQIGWLLEKEKPLLHLSREDTTVSVSQ